MEPWWVKLTYGSPSGGAVTDVACPKCSHVGASPPGHPGDDYFECLACHYEWAWRIVEKPLAKGNDGPSDAYGEPRPANAVYDKAGTPLGLKAKHPLPDGTCIKTLQGEEDGNGFALPGAVGIVEKLLGVDLTRGRGHYYSVVFPLLKRQARPDNRHAEAVCVILDEHEELDDAEQYEINPEN